MQLFSKLLVGLMLAMSLLVPVTAMAVPDLGMRDQVVANETGLATGDPRVMVARIIRTAMGLLGILAVVIIIYGGFIWMTAGGSEEKVGEAKKWLFSGIIGLVIILSAFAIASFVINSLVNATINTAADINY